MSKEETFLYTQSRRYKLMLATVSSIFSFLFFLFFQPFGINNYRADEKITLVLIGALLVFSAFVFLGFIFCEFVLRSFLRLKSKRGIFVIWIFIELLIICSLTFLIYNYAGNFHDFYLSSYLKHILEMGSVLIFPILGTLFYFKHTSVIKDYEEIVSISKAKSELDELVLISGDYKKDQIALKLNSIVFIQSEDNYVGLNYVENDQLKRYLIRSTLSGIEKKLTSDYYVRCNRSTIANLYHLESFKPGSNKMILKLKAVNSDIEVSKSHQNKVSELVGKLSHQ